MNIQKTCRSEAPMIASTLQDAVEWLAGDGRPLWSTSKIVANASRGTCDGIFHVARQDGQAVAVAHAAGQSRRGTIAASLEASLICDCSQDGITARLLFSAGSGGGFLSEVIWLAVWHLVGRWWKTLERRGKLQ
jgi:hypothetical protein